MKYAALLRGINVAGQKRVPMADLKKIFESLKFKNIETYIQSGNVVFEYDRVAKGDHEWETAAIVTAIEQAIQKKFAFKVDVIVRTEKDWPKILKSNPYPAEAKKEPKFLHVYLLAAAPENPQLEELKKYCQAGEKYKLKGSEFYVFYGSGAGKSKLVLNVIEKKLGVGGTARNWLTMLTLSEMLGAK
jgi:uncharacterized protein (DUF1697 family)